MHYTATHKFINYYMTSFDVLHSVRFNSLNLFQWWHREILSGMSISAKFSFMQRLDFFKVRLKALYCPLVSHVSHGEYCFSLKVQYSIDFVVSFDLQELNVFCGLHNISWRLFHIFLCIFFGCIYCHCILQQLDINYLMLNKIHLVDSPLWQGNCMVFVVLWAWVIVFFYYCVVENFYKLVIWWIVLTN